MPSSSPPANAMGIDRSRPRTAAVAATNKTPVYVAGSRLKSGEPATPAIPASRNPSSQADADVRRMLMPLIEARLGRSTVARIGKAQAGVADHVPERDGGNHRETEDDDLVGIDPHRTEGAPADLGNGTESGGRENRVGTRDVDVHVVDQDLDDVQHQRGNRDEQTDGRDEARGLARSHQTAEDDSVEQQAEPGCEDDDGRRWPQGRSASAARCALRSRRARWQRRLRRARS